MNNAILRLAQGARTLNEVVSVPHSTGQNGGIEKAFAALAKALNEILRIVDGENNQVLPVTNGGIKLEGSLCALKEIILSAIGDPHVLNEPLTDLSGVGITTFISHGGIGLDAKGMKEALSPAPGEVIRTAKFVASALCETLPLCVDPNSGSLVFTGRKLNGDGEDKTARAVSDLGDEMEKARTELEGRLRTADSLISCSRQLINELTPAPESFIVQDGGYAD